MTENDTASDGQYTDLADEDTEQGSVLIVDDEPRVCEAFQLWLQDDYHVVTATDGEKALERMDDIDVVLLDRHMPGLSGDEVLERIREAGYDCRVAMVTAVDPDFDIVEMPFDHYVSKPVDGERLQEVVDRLLGIERYGEKMTTLYGLMQKIGTLEAEKTRAELAESERYADLVERRERLQEEMDGIVSSLDTSEIDSLFETAAASDEWVS
ncbi:response regulator [Haloplanus sp. C73]|uniref:response regulator n=1 Tax=Haloplanus sp. C73 TaxID=3421641 RepID=UPI003EBD0430